MRVDARIRAIVDEINCDTLADIGADHGKMSVLALMENRAKTVYAVDISEKSLDKAVKLAATYGVSDRLIPLVGDGLTPVKGNPDQIIICGMGGNEIIKILSDADYRGAAVLVPHQDEDLLRRYISGRFAVEKDFYVEVSGKFYPIIKVNVGATVYTEEELYSGLDLPHSESFRPYLYDKRKRLEKIADTHTLPNNDIRKKLTEIEKICRKLGI